MQRALPACGALADTPGPVAAQRQIRRDRRAVHAHREAGVVVFQLQLAGRGYAQLERAFGQRLRVGAIQHRQPELAVVARAAPVDVEPVGMLAAAAVLEHVPPPRIGRMGGHVVGHDVQQQAHVVRAHRRVQRHQPLLAAQLGIDAGRVGDVVAMGRAGHGRADRRQIEMAHAQLRVVRHLRGGIVQGEAFMQLQARGGA